MTSVGIDGCKAGWVAVHITDTGFEVKKYNRIEEICAKYKDADCMLVDMPIGLPESANEIRPETEARKLLRGRAPCIFNAPCRQAVYTEEYREASLVNQLVLGKGISKQSFFISNKIREIDEFLQQYPKYKETLVESHPEICFAVLASVGQEEIFPLKNSKRSEVGISDRIKILRKFYDKTEDIVAFIRKHNTLSKLQEDCLDALCLALTGRLGLQYGFVTIPEHPQTDARGFFMQMKYAFVKEFGNKKEESR